MSLQRLKNVHLATEMAGTGCLRELSSFMTDAGYRNWNSLHRWASKPPSRSGGGFVAEGFQARGMSQAPDCGASEAFILRMRALFGVSARPEVLAWLLTHRAGYAAEIARDIDWFLKSVQAILNELELSGLLVSQAVGKRKLFSLNRGNETLHPSLGNGLRWFSQSGFYRGVSHIESTLHALQQAPNRSAHARAIKIREILTPLNTALRLAGLGEVFPGTSHLAGDALIDCFHRGARSIQNILSKRDFPTASI